MNLYHVTPFRNYESIMKKGLIPQIGKNSQTACETKELVFMFPDLETLNTALGSWLGNCFKDDEELCILEINGDELDIYPKNFLLNTFERWTEQTIEPKHITLLKRGV